MKSLFILVSSLVRATAESHKAMILTALSKETAKATADLVGEFVDALIHSDLAEAIVATVELEKQLANHATEWRGTFLSELSVYEPSIQKMKEMFKALDGDSETEEAPEQPAPTPAPAKVEPPHASQANEARPPRYQARRNNGWIRKS